MGIKLIEGKNFGDPKNNINEVIINEMLENKLGLEEPVVGPDLPAARREIDQPAAEQVDAATRELPDGDAALCVTSRVT